MLAFIVEAASITNLNFRTRYKCTPVGAAAVLMRKATSIGKSLPRDLLIFIRSQVVLAKHKDPIARHTHPADLGCASNHAQDEPVSR